MLSLLVPNEEMLYEPSTEDPFPYYEKDFDDLI